MIGVRRYEDSTGKRIRIGQIVRNRGEVFQIESFEGGPRFAVINFVGTDVKGDEMSVDLLTHEYPRLLSAAEWDKRGDWMPFLKGCREEWKEKAQDSFLATDGMYELREEILDRIFNQLDILEKGKS